MPVVATYPYVSASGELLFTKERIEPGENGRPKDFRITKPGGEGAAVDVQRPLYNLPSVLRASSVWIVEGEKDAGTCARLGLVATTQFDGAGGRWREDYTEALSGKQIFACGDNDEPGRKHVERICEELGSRSKVYVVRIPDQYKDITEYIEAGNTADDLNVLVQEAMLPANHPIAKLKQLQLKRGEPAALTSERVVLGAVLDGKVPLEDIKQLLPEAFYLEANRIVFSAIVEIEQSSGSCDLPTVQQHLESKGLLEKIGGVAAMTDYVEDLPNTFNIDSHIEAILSKAAGRKLLKVLSDGATALLVGSPAEEVAQTTSKAIEGSCVVSGERDMGILDAAEIMGTLSGFLAPRKRGVMCEPINPVLAGMYGLHPGLVVIAARSSHGKSSLASQIAAYAARDGFPVDIFSFEVSKEDCLLKMICMCAKVPMVNVWRGDLSDKQARRLAAVASEFSELPIYIDDRRGWNMQKLRSHCKKNPRKIRIFDYLQLWPMGKTDRRDLELGAITAGMKALAIEFGEIWIALSQLNRDGVKAGRRPILSDMKDSDCIVNDSDVILFTHLEPDQESDPYERDGWIINAKTRNGPIGEWPVKFSKSFTFFHCDGRQLDYPALLS